MSAGMQRRIMLRHQREALAATAETESPWTFFNVPPPPVRGTHACCLLSAGAFDRLAEGAALGLKRRARVPFLVVRHRRREELLA